MSSVRVLPNWSHHHIQQLPSGRRTRPILGCPGLLPVCPSSRPVWLRDLLDGTFQVPPAALWHTHYAGSGTVLGSQLNVLFLGKTTSKPGLLMALALVVRLPHRAPTAALLLGRCAGITLSWRELCFPLVFPFSFGYCARSPGLALVWMEQTRLPLSCRCPSPGNLLNLQQLFTPNMLLLLSDVFLICC